MTATSLRKRFFTNTTIVALVVLVVAVFVIDISYRDELNRSVQEKLQLHIFTLLSVAQLDNDQLFLPDISYNPRLNTRDSDLWAVVLDVKKNTAWHSLSIDNIPEQLHLASDIGKWHFDTLSLKEKDYLTGAYHVSWDNNGIRYDYHFVVAEDKQIVSNIIQRFRWWLFGGFALITIVLLMCLFVVLSLAFRPISTLEREIVELEQGKKNTLSGPYPKELQSVTRNLNSLIEKEHRQRERYRTTMADLAHSLKTPMAVIRTEITRYPENIILQNAIAHADKNIEYQLRRAVISGHTLLNQGTNIQDVVDLVVEALQKIYINKAITLLKEIDQKCNFAGDENDLMEILGNLLDNAYKYARNKVRITVYKEAKKLFITVEDDGTGIDQKALQKIFDRGERLDRLGMGQGIGLAVVADIVNGYQGSITTSTSGLGGAMFTLIFPA